MDLKNFIYKRDEDIYINKELLNVEYYDSSENYLLDVFNNAEDNPIYPLKFYRYIRDWPSRYHLDYKRLNLIEAFRDIINGGKVLELGAGTGILTGLLSFYNKSVDAIEGNLKRALIIRKRLKTVNNCRVFVDDIYKTDFPKNEYDFVTIVGVLEYIPFYYSDFSTTSIENVTLNFLKKVSETLKEKGILLLAIENKFGAKYFSGCNEDHNGKLFSGILGYPFRSPITFSRNELFMLLKKAGFVNIQFYHLFPDYKLPKLFIRECEEFYEISPSGLWRGFFEEYAGERKYFFSDSLFVENIIKSRMLSYFSNSFVILASKTPEVNLKTKWIIKKFYNDYPHNPKNHHSIEIVKDDDRRELNKYYVKREPLYIADAIWEFSDNIYMYKLNPRMNFIKGESLYIKILKAFSSENLDNVIYLLNLIKNTLIDKFGIKGFDHEGYPISNYPIDYTAWNLLEDERGDIIFIDNKWITLKALPCDFIVFRTLLYILMEELVILKDKRNATIKDLIIDIMKRIFSSYNYNRLLYNINLEADFQAFATGEIKENILSRLKDAIFLALSSVKVEDELVRVRNELDAERQAKVELQTKLTQVEDELVRVYLSKSWRITRPLRWLRRKLKV